MAPYGATAYAPAPFVLPPNHDSKAVASLILGLSSLVCLGALTGLPAIILGAVARRDIERSQGRTTGAGIAAGGIMTGLFGTGLSVVLAVCVIAGVLDASQASGIAPTEGPVPIAAGTRSYGSLDVVDLDEEQPLAEQLEEIVKNATGKGKTLVLQTYVRTSRECAEVASALPDQRMQRALANVTLVRVDVDVFESELLTMRVDTDSVPWFYKLDRSGRVIDAINADEWDENTATNMAPILGEFARGTLSSRRNPSPLGTEL